MSRIVGKFNLIKINDLDNFFNSGIFQHDSINKKGTKIKEKIKYIYFLDVLKKKLFLEQDDYIIPFFEEKSIYIPKIIINGYIEHELNEKENEMILSLLNKIFPFLFHKKYFYFIYKKLSKIYRQIISLKNIKIINFNKVFNLWKLFFSYDDIIKLDKKYIYLYRHNNIEINIPFVSNNYAYSIINIFFYKSPLFSILNKNKNNFSIIKLYYIDKKKNKNEICNIKYKDIIEPKNENNINSIQFIIYENKISYKINDENNIKDIQIKNENFNYNKMKLLNNFNGKISYIEIIRKYKNKNISETKIGIKPDKDNIKIDFNNNKEENIEIKIKNNNKKNVFYKYYPDILYENIKYYGGIESFIPILKIISKLFLLYKNKKNKEIIDKIKDLYKTFIKLLLNIIYFSELNLYNFYEIIIPLLSALSEIDTTINSDIKNELYKDNNFYNLFILISISPCSTKIKNIIQKFFGINISNMNLNFVDFKNSEKILLKYNKSLDWYSFMIFIKIEFIILTTNDINKIPKGFFSILLSIYNSINNNINLVKNIPEEKKTKIKLMIQLFFLVLNNIYEKIKIPENFKEIKDFNLLNYIKEFSNDEEYLILLIFKMMKIMFSLNKSGLIQFGDNTKKNKVECSFSKFYILFLSLKGIFHRKNKNNENLKKKYKEIMKYFPENKSLILEILDDNKEVDFIKIEENIIEDLLDFHSQYRHLMKELFYFNHFWSDEKLFFCFRYKIKYKNINYYTNNFQRPILYPILDYKNKYPKFSYFKIDNNFYLKENKDNNQFNSTKENEEFEYNFDFNCSELDKLIEDNNKEIISLIEKKYIENIQTYDACLIKRTHHIKGKIFIITIKGLPKKIYFYSCTKKDQIFNKNNYNRGIFPCPIKDTNRKLCIELKDIKLIIRRIFFYKKSGIEIYTNSKSYFFNFFENGEYISEIIINLLVYYAQNNLYPININGNIIGFSKIFFDQEKIQENKDLIFFENKYVNELINNWIKLDKCNKIEKNISSFDALIYLNLLSNRSYNDIYQYPVFPLLFFYDINNKSIIERDLENHIGFQNVTKMSEKRKKKIINIFKSKKDEIESGINREKISYYFESNFSNINYICNYLIRIFPYTFISIELQGDGYDNKNFFDSIEDTFYNISFKENDLRELIPEFFYFPEMFLNINKLNFNKNNDNKNINDVKISEELINENNKDNNICNIKINSNSEKNLFYLYCKFISNMRSNLEKKYIEIFKWKNLIFGNKQKHLNKSETDLLFKPETYISFNENKNEILNKEKINNIEFGILPNQIIYEESEIDIKLNDKILLNNNDNDLIYIEKKINHYKNINNKEIIDFSYLDTKIIINKKIPKIEILNEGKLYKEFYENISYINYFHFNKKLNMFIISSIDGFLLLYILPGKLINVIKHPIKNNFFDFCFLSSNPFPNIIAFDKKDKNLYSFSINGFFIKKINLYDFSIFNFDQIDDIKIFPIFDDEKGIYKDVIIIQNNKEENINIQKLKETKEKNTLILNVPFFEKISVYDIFYYK